MRSYSLCFSILGILSDLAASIILLNGAMISDDKINELCGTYYGHNLFAHAKLIKDRRDSRRVLILITVGSIFQGLSVFYQHLNL